MLIITAVGPDKPGMAHAVVSRLAALGCNIEDTTMTRLSGEFAMILIVSLPPQINPSQVDETLAPLRESHGLFINCKDIDEAAPELAEGTPRYVVSVYGPERTGLLAGITEVLATVGANITDLQTRVASAGTVYVMIFEVELPPHLAGDDLTSALAERARELGVQVTVRALEEETL